VPGLRTVRRGGLRSRPPIPAGSGRGTNLESPVRFVPRPDSGGVRRDAASAAPFVPGQMAGPRRIATQT